MAVITLFALSCSIYMHHRCTSNNHAIIMTDKTPIKKSPRLSDKDVAFTLPEGTKVEIIDSVTSKQYGEGNGWYKIETPDERSGWIGKSSTDKQVI